MKKIPYRFQQLYMALRASPLTSSECEEVRKKLTPPQAALYFGLPVYEQRHALRVCRTLQSAGHTDPELLQAALLHDIGKRDPESGRTITIWGKTVNIVLRTIGGNKLVARVARPDPRRWRYVFWLQLRHEQRGMELAEAAGSSPKVVALVGGQVPPGDPFFTALKWADDQN
jgi:hypothetical protein